MFYIRKPYIFRMISRNFPYFREKTLLHKDLIVSCGSLFQTILIAFNSQMLDLSEYLW
jgi:hypothetical protein